MMLKGCKSSATPANPPLCVELHWIHIKGTNVFVFKDFFFFSHFWSHLSLGEG